MASRLGPPRWSLVTPPLPVRRTSLSGTALRPASVPAR
jgi:hypothetical protein